MIEDGLVRRLAATMAPEDRRELWAMAHHSPYEGLTKSLAASFESGIWIPDGEPICGYGLSILSLVPLTISPWLLASSAVTRYPTSFLRGSRRWIAEQMAQYPRLVNYVGAWHHRSVRWLTWLGFTLEAPRQIGLDRDWWHRAIWEGDP